MGQAMETAHPGFLEQEKGSAFLSQQSSDSEQSCGHFDLHELFTSGRIEERVEQLLQELFPDDPISATEVDVPTFTGYFDHFELLEQIGRGAFSRVFKAIDKKLGNRLVVLKTGKLIEQEPSIVGRLNHKHIMPVYSSWQDQLGATTICMPYLGRYTLQDKVADLQRQTRRQQKVEGGKMEISMSWKRHPEFSNLLAILTEVGQALVYAHHQEVLHLDIKPSNVLVGFCGHALLLDFNLAGDFLIQKSPMGGTLSYMSPEHLRRCVLQETVDLDARSDIYSLGVLMFEMFFGYRPFDSAGPPMRARFQTRMMLGRQQRVNSLFEKKKPGIPRQLTRIIQRCLQFDPASRYSAVAELVRALSKLG